MAVATVHCAKLLGALTACAALGLLSLISMLLNQAPLPSFLSQKFSRAGVLPTPLPKSVPTEPSQNDRAGVLPTPLPKSVPTEPSQNDQLVLTQHPGCKITAFKVYTGTLEEKRAWFLSRLADYSQPFSFVRFGDGEWMCAFGTTHGKNIDLQTFNRIMCKRLKQFLLDVESRKSVHMFLQGHECQFTKRLNALHQGIGHWYHFRGFLDLLYSGKMAKAMALVRGRGRVVLVGPRPLSKLKIAFGYSAYIEVPQRAICGSDVGAEFSVDSLVAQILAESKREPSNVTFLVAGGMAMKVVVLEAARHLHHKDSFLDIGSTFTHFAANKIRNFKNQGKELTLDHYETHPDADYRSMRAWFNTTAGDGCDQLGTFSSKYEKRAELCGVQSVWREYMLFHNSCRFRTDCAVLRWQCVDGDTCGGTADQQRGLVSALLIAIITKRMLLVHWTRFGVNIQSLVFAPGMIDTRASPLYADRCKRLQHEAPLRRIDPRTTREADRIVKTVKESKKLCLGLQTNLKPELLLASSAAKGFEGFKGFYDLPLRGCAHRFMFKPGNSVWVLNKTVSGPQMGIHLRLGDQAFGKNDRVNMSVISSALACAENLGTLLFNGTWSAFIVSDSILAKKYLADEFRKKGRNSVTSTSEPVHSDRKKKPGVDAQQSINAIFQDLASLAHSDALVVGGQKSHSGFAELAVQLGMLPPERVRHSLDGACKEYKIGCAPNCKAPAT